MERFSVFGLYMLLARGTALEVESAAPDTYDLGNVAMQPLYDDGHGSADRAARSAQTEACAAALEAP